MLFGLMIDDIQYILLFLLLLVCRLLRHRRLRRCEESEWNGMENNHKQIDNGKEEKQDN